MSSSYEKTKKQYAASTLDNDACRFKAGLKWYMNEKESIITRIQPEFEGFGKDVKSNISYTQYIDEYTDYLKKGDASGMGRQVSLFEDKYKKQIYIKNINM
tara:strand:- start:233 stop:535 length:303 start_codon:yes stop_codon:yes gene_type:complete